MLNPPVLALAECTDILKVRSLISYMSSSNSRRTHLQLLACRTSSSTTVVQPGIGCQPTPMSLIKPLQCCGLTSASILDDCSAVLARYETGIWDGSVPQSVLREEADCANSQQGGHSSFLRDAPSELVRKQRVDDCCAVKVAKRGYAVLPSTSGLSPNNLALPQMALTSVALSKISILLPSLPFSL